MSTDPNALFAVVVYMADQGAPVVIRKLKRHDVWTIKLKIEASISGQWSTPSHQTMGAPYLTYGDQMLVAAHISRLQVFPDHALDIPPEQRPPQIGFELFRDC